MITMITIIPHNNNNNHNNNFNCKIFMSNALSYAKHIILFFLFRFKSVKENRCICESDQSFLLALCPLIYMRFRIARALCTISKFSCLKDIFF